MRTPKNFDLSKIRAKSLKICTKSLKIRAKMVSNVVCLLKQSRPTFAKKHMKNFFIEGDTIKRFS